MRVDAAPDRPFGGDLDRIGCRRQLGKAKPVEMRMPCGLVGKGRFWLFRQPGDQRGGQGAAAHVVECCEVEHEVGMAGTQQIEEIQPALRWPRAEPRPAAAKAGVNRLLPIWVQKRFAIFCAVHQSVRQTPSGTSARFANRSTDVQDDVCNPARSTSRDSARNPSGFLVSRRSTSRLEIDRPTDCNKQSAAATWIGPSSLSDLNPWRNIMPMDIYMT